MRQQCQVAFKHLVIRHCQQQQQKQQPQFCRRLTQSYAATRTTSQHHNNNYNTRNKNLLHLPSCITTQQHKDYSKFSTHLSTERALELICNLDEEERLNLRDAMFKLEADKEKKQYESQLAVGSWRTRFGRLSSKPALNQVDPTGTFCAVSDEWLKKKLVENARPPTANELCSIFFVNAVPFVAFGFLDNFIMIIAGEYIEFYLGHFITLSTMAAAGLGNTISDIMGISMATYVENGCQYLGLKQPKLTPAQFELKSSRRASSWGRIIGITVGCLLGMSPLWFMSNEERSSESTSKEEEKEGTNS